MDEEIPMIRRNCEDCGQAYWVIEEEDDGFCNACYYKNDPDYYLNIVKK